MDLQTVFRRVDDELGDAAWARAAGNEGRARVSARRAAGIALEAYFTGLNGRPTGMNAYHLLKRAEAAPALTPAVRQSAARLIARVSEAFELPHSEDPLEDAVGIANAVLEMLVRERGRV